jgi:hypothetical protein
VFLSDIRLLNLLGRRFYLDVLIKTLANKKSNLDTPILLASLFGQIVTDWTARSETVGL